MSPEPLTIRDAADADAAGIATVHIDSSRDVYAPLASAWPEPDLSRRTAVWARRVADTSAARVLLVAVSSDHVVGFLGAGPARAGGFGDVEVYVIHVHPEHRGVGIGRRLWAEAAPRLRDNRRLSLYVETLAELRCCRFYGAHGGQVARRQAGEYHGGAVTELVYRWPAGVSSELRPYRFRAATAVDAELLFDLKRSAYRDHVAAIYGAWDEPWQRDRFMAKFDPAMVQVIVVDGRDVGAVSVDDGVDPEFFGSIELSPMARGRGVGTSVIRDAVDRAKARGREVQLQVFRTNGAAQRLYARLGFAIVGQSATHTTMRSL